MYIYRQYLQVQYHKQQLNEKVEENIRKKKNGGKRLYRRDEGREEEIERKK